MSTSLATDKVKESANGYPSMSTSLLKTLLQIVEQDAAPEAIRTKIRLALISAAEAIGACHLFQEQDGAWTLRESHISGETPDPGVLSPTLARICDSVIDERCLGTIHVAPLTRPQNHVGLFADISGSDQLEPEIILLVIQHPENVIAAKLILGQVAKIMRLWTQREQCRRVNSELNSLSAVLEIVLKIESCETLEQAHAETANELSQHLDCVVATGDLLTRTWLSQSHPSPQIRLRAISNSNQLDLESETSRNWSAALDESVCRNSPGQVPIANPDNGHMLLAHQNLRQTLAVEHVYSQPLTDRNGTTVGSMIAASCAIDAEERFTRFLRAAAPYIGSALESLSRRESSRIKRGVNFFKRTVSRRARTVLALAVLGTLLTLMIPVDYRVNCACTTEPVSCRFAVAPFDGLIENAFVKPGDQVKEGQILAHLDDRSLRWEQSGIEAERQKTERQQKIELADGNIGASLLAKLESDRLKSRQKTLDYNSQRLEVKSPITGVVLSGSLERAEAASVTTGQLLFEIGPLNPMKVEIAVPASERAQVKIGQSAKAWVEGHNGDAIEGEITRIHPRSQIRNGRNVFVAEVEFENVDHAIQPGMKGHARILGERCTIGWAVFHGPINYVRSCLTWW